MDLDLLPTFLQHGWGKTWVSIPLILYSEFDCVVINFLVFLTNFLKDDSDEFCPSTRIWIVVELPIFRHFCDGLVVSGWEQMNLNLTFIYLTVKRNILHQKPDIINNQIVTNEHCPINRIGLIIN